MEGSLWTSDVFCKLGVLWIFVRLKCPLLVSRMYALASRTLLEVVTDPGAAYVTLRVRIRDVRRKIERMIRYLKKGVQYDSERGYVAQCSWPHLLDA